MYIVTVELLSELSVYVQEKQIATDVQLHTYIYFDDMIMYIP